MADRAPSGTHVLDSDPGKGARVARSFAIVSGVGVLVLAVGYFALIRTSWGQGFDNDALVARVYADRDVVKFERDLLQAVTVTTLVVMAIVLLVVGLVRRRGSLALVAGIGFVGAVVSAELLKDVLPRPDLHSAFATELHDKGIDTYPSGHSTIATAFALSLILVSSPRLRPWVTIFGALWASLIATGTLAAGWHRPSDAVGGIALASAWCFGAAAVWARKQAQWAPPTRLGAALPWLVGVVGAVAVGGVVVGLKSQSVEVATNASEFAFAISQVVIDVTCIAVVGYFGWTLRDVLFSSDAEVGQSLRHHDAL